MIKHILFDADGVIIKPRQKYFSEKFSEDYKIPLDDIGPFFKNDYKKAARGEVDIKDILPEYLEKWGWNGDVDSFISYWFDSEKDLDLQLLKLIQNLRQKGMKCSLVSDNEMYRAEYLLNNLELKNSFDNTFFSYKLGTTKSDPAFFKKVAQELSLNPSDILFWDDDIKNVDIAKAEGIKAYEYRDYGDFIRKMDELILDVMKNIFAFDTNDFYCDSVFSGKIQIQKIKETDNILAFYHTRPSWTTHIVIVPKKHITTLLDVEDPKLFTEIFSMAQEIINELGLKKTNFRIITNGGSFQDSKHLHFHLVSGEQTRG